MANCYHLCVTTATVVLLLLAHLGRAAGGSLDVAFFQGSCNSLASCEHKCVNTSFGYTCKCKPGYNINRDGFSCSEISSLGSELPDGGVLIPKNPAYSNVRLPGKLPTGTSAAALSETNKSNRKGNSIDASRTLKEKKHPTEDSGEDVVIQHKNGIRVEKYKIQEPSGELEQRVVLNSHAVDNLLLHLCNGFTCENNSTCVVLNSKPRCSCPLNTAGLHCEKELTVRYPKLDGQGFVAFPVLRDVYKEFQVYLEIKPETTNGLLLFSAEHIDAQGDFFSILLVNGHVEFRFDCGTGMAILKSRGRVQIGQWNSIFIQRIESLGSVRLNSEESVQGKAKGDYSRITLRTDLFLGGYPNMSVIVERVGLAEQFVGCIQELVINSKKYDMRKNELVGQAIYGANVEECSSNVCLSVVCQNGGTCSAKSADTHVCLCPLGTAGDNCEQKADLHIPSFNGNSFLSFPGLDRTMLSFTEIELIIKPQSPDGVILYNGYTLDRKGDFIMLAMSRGHLEFRFDLGTGPAVIWSPKLVSLNKWHIVRISRTGRDGILEVDDQPRAEGLAQGAYTQLTLLQNFYIGGHRNFDETSRYANISKSFTGCIQKVVINEKPLKILEEAVHGINVGNCEHPCLGKPCMNNGVCVANHDDYMCYCPLGFQNTNCEDNDDDNYLNTHSSVAFKATTYWRKPQFKGDNSGEGVYCGFPLGSFVNPAPPGPSTLNFGRDSPTWALHFLETNHKITAAQFAGNSFLRYKGKNLSSRTVGTKIDIQMWLKPKARDGLLFWVGKDQVSSYSDYLALGFSEGTLQFRYNLGSGEALISFNMSQFYDGRWHFIRAQRDRDLGYLEVDSHTVVEGCSPGNYVSLNTNRMVFIGGMPDVALNTLRRFTSGYTGCLANVTLATDYHLDLVAEAEIGQNVWQCS